jgi:hypothetical protein
VEVWPSRAGDGDGAKGHEANDKSTLIYVIEINGRGVLAFNADSQVDAERKAQSPMPAVNWPPAPGYTDARPILRAFAISRGVFILPPSKFDGKGAIQW